MDACCKTRFAKLGIGSRKWDTDISLALDEHQDLVRAVFREHCVQPLQRAPSVSTSIQVCQK
eukprot:565940-Rhodomonas_salina.2